MDEFLYYYQPLEISQSLGFYQFSARGSNCRLVKSLPMSNRRWKIEFFFISRFWAVNLVELDRDPFPPYIGEKESSSRGYVTFHYSFYFFCYIYLTLFAFFFTTVRQPSLSKFYLERV